jgi:acyl-CoA thioester hydrolase
MMVRGSESGLTAFTWPVRVYYEDTDAGGVVYHANFLRFMERARTEWLYSMDFAHDRLRSEWGVVFAVRGAQMDWRRPAFLGDALTVSCALTRVTRVRLEVEHNVCRDREVLVSAQVLLACVDGARFAPAAIPRPLREAIQLTSGDRS